MEYAKRTKHGDMGEHLVVFKVIQNLDWPCRLLTSDLGIDAETEILTPEGQTTGDIIRLQIKSVQTVARKDSFSITTSDAHIAYWQRHCTPVIFCGVCLETERVFWKQITSLDDYSTTGQSKKVSFCCEHDLMNRATAEAWRKFATPEAAHKLRELMAQYEQICERTKNGAGDRAACNSYEDLFKEGVVIKDEIKNIIAFMPWKITGVQLNRFKAMQKELERRKSENSFTSMELYYN